MKRVVADTNVLLSALLFGGVPGMFLDLAFLKNFELVTSPILLEELRDKLCGKFKILPDNAERIIERLSAHSEVVDPIIRLAVVLDDPDDDRVLECAQQGIADFIVSGDKHLLLLVEFDGIPIYTVRQFVDLLRNEHPR